MQHAVLGPFFYVIALQVESGSGDAKQRQVFVGPSQFATKGRVELLGQREILRGNECSEVACALFDQWVLLPQPARGLCRQYSRTHIVGDLSRDRRPVVSR